MLALGIWGVFGLIFGLNLLGELLHTDEMIFVRHKWKFIGLFILSGPIMWILCFGGGSIALANYVAKWIKDADKKTNILLKEIDIEAPVDELKIYVNEFLEDVDNDYPKE
jgi:hypothetical protein